MQRQPTRDLPTNKNPVGTRCIQLTIPDDDEWEQDAYSELYRLALWMLWERNPGKDGAPVAKRWLQALDTWRHCDGSPSPIIASGEFNMSELCELLRWHEGKLQAWCCGEWSDIPTDGTAPIPGTGGQPSSGSRPAAGVTQCFPVLLDAGKQWLLPFAVNAGDTITISDLKGAWKNGATGGWTCTDGTPFVFGACIGARYHLTGDPDPTLYHGQLAVLIDGVYYSATSGAFTVPLGVSNANATIVGNFEQLTGSGGEITFKVCVTNGGVIPADDWCAVLDFTASTYGWVSDTDDAYPGIWTLGEGWHNNPALGGKAVIKYTMPGAQTFKALSEMYCYSSDTDHSGGVNAQIPGTGNVIQYGPITMGNFTATGGGANRTGTLWHMEIQNGSAPVVQIRGAKIYGSGPIPAGWPTC